jgi:hypothetical protein
MCYLLNGEVWDKVTLLISRLNEYGTKQFGFGVFQSSGLTFVPINVSHLVEWAQR